MSQAWKPEYTVEADQALSMVADQFPEIKPKAIRLLGSGWDNTAYLINDTYVFRFPRRTVAVPLIETERCLLPKIASYLLLPIPVPKWYGLPTDLYPWPFIGYHMLPGKTACHYNILDDKRLKFVEPLGRFLNSLHSIPLSVASICQLKGDVIGRLNVDRLVGLTRKNLEELASLSLFENSMILDALIDRNLDSTEGPVIVHGDFYVRHLLVNDSLRLTGVIDWGDVHLGDPAADLAIAHSFLPYEAHEAFLSFYGKVPEGTWNLSRLRAFYHSSIMALYGHHSKDPAILKESLRSLQQIATQKL